jgi:hypothetical protein
VRVSDFALVLGRVLTCLLGRRMEKLRCGYFVFINEKSFFFANKNVERVSCARPP